MKTVYLDHAATTPPDDEVLSLMFPYFSGRYGNPSSMHTSGRRAAQALAQARERAAQTINASPDEIIFTGSGTESDNLAVIGAARANQSRGKHVIISTIEHKAVLESARTLERAGFEVSVAPVDAQGMIDVASILSLVRDDTTLISIMFANNEIGTVMPISELSKTLSERRKKTGLPLIHTDACQAAGHFALDVKELGIDLMTLNGSKVYGPKGVGLLYKKEGTKLSPVIVGGGQENDLRAGTESLPLIMGMAFALEKAERIREEESVRLTELREYFISRLETEIPGIIINGHPKHFLPHIVHVTVPSVEGESMVLMLDEAGVETATGSACSAKDLRPSHVLTATGQNDELIHGSVRFSFGRGTTREELDYALSVFRPIVEKLKGASALTTNYYAKEKRLACPTRP
ncbi:MAG: cysteine desulfurase family protein [bacterium]|nr:cysteine desulfurase family protein [bacterium]